MKLEQQKGERIHTRNISVTTYECTDGGILVEGILKDDRLKPYYRLSGEKHDPHTVHHLIIRMLVNGPPLTISAVEAEMPGVPQEACPETKQSIKILEGWRIEPGFTEKAKNTLGGREGCVHLTALVMAMAPAAVQGFWANHSRKPLPKEISSDIVDQYLIDTCWVWRREGPLAQELLKRVSVKTDG